MELAVAIFAIFAATGAFYAIMYAVLFEFTLGATMRKMLKDVKNTKEQA